MNNQQVEPLFQTLIDFANDAHDVSSAIEAINSHFNGVIPGSFLAWQISELNRFLKERDRDSVLGMVLVLRSLVRDLSVIRDARVDLHTKFRSAAKRSTYADYFGHRMEIKAAADLIRKGIRFSASSVKSVGELRLRKLAKYVIQGEFCDSERAKPV